ncbi:acyl-CoA dehydrogenase family protein [Actinomadura sp. 7K507]|uniref:acyl-CoA dehydrogenase family protein n=1 Tax=Actinomadura sp. 7K507 TaxID=2530365 RepID=UPI0010508DD3|nr:acyl-CoA dehydrogenase family protein [Actinomadura sp. 7K507]TDC91337.1 acyl-CoA dehydrogenase [Actinomadura sp. 7K507]
MTAPGPDVSPIEYSGTALEFRDEIRDWLKRNAPDDLRGVPVPRVPDPELKAHLDRWGDALTDAGLMCVAWPEEYGGRGLSGVEVALMNEEFARAGVPRLTRGMGEGLVGPAVIAHGTEEQKRRMLPPIISGEHDYCQGFSEPDAGSDLAGLRTRGEVDGTDLVINGQKTWTSGYYKANWMFCLVRTDPAAPKHRGISYVVLPLEVDGGPNGVEFRPIMRMTGQALFGESYLTDARTPLGNVIGGLNQGWKVAMTTLGNERGGSATTQHVAFEAQFWRLVEEARKRGLHDDVRVREQLAWAWSQIQVIKATGLGLVADLAAGRSGEGLANGSTSKIRWSEFQRRLAEIAMDLLGPDALLTGAGYELSEWQDEFLATRSHTIWGGTAEVQRNIIGERVLGLPKEPKAAKEAAR